MEHTGLKEYTIFIQDWHPTTLNKLLSLHWSRAGKLKKADKAVIWPYSFGIPNAEGKKSVEIIITLAGPGRSPDPDAYLKTVGDALVACGKLKDDNIHGVEWLPVKLERGKRKATKIVLRDMA